MAFPRTAGSDEEAVRDGKIGRLKAEINKKDPLLQRAKRVRSGSSAMVGWTGLPGIARAV